MLMSEQQIRLNEVIQRVKKTVDFMCFVQENHGEHNAFRDLDQHIAAYRRLLEALEKEERQVGGLPRDPDPEFELIEQVMTRLKPLVTGDREQVLLEEFSKLRRAILTSVDQALECDYPDNIQDTLREIARYTHQL